ncbi:MAG: hypothetical protein MUO70_08265, partial [Euryarchaeota archaeon]|nr:hypothetical protein [Euryarchaeota archaeon]
MIEKGLILTGNDADLLDRALSEVKIKVYEESEPRLDDTQALDALASCFRNASNDEQEEERRHSYFSPLRKRLVLGTIIDRKVGADVRKTRSRQDHRVAVQMVSGTKIDGMTLVGSVILTVAAIIA